MNYLINILIIKLSLCLVDITSSARVACRDENGQAIDWWSAFKLPKSKSKSSTQSNTLIVNGTAYIYLTDKSQNWSLSSQSLDASSSMAAKTLELIYTSQKNGDIGFMMYNDQVGGDDGTPLVANSRKAHAKGVLVFDSETALWLIHSIPNYPPVASTGQYKLAASQTVYAQSMLCLSVSLSEVSKIGQQLMYIYPQVYDSYVPDALLKLNNQTGYLNNLLGVIKATRVPSAPWFNVNELTTLNDAKFLAFHKDPRFNADLYASLVAPNLKSPLFTETWSHGVGTMPTNCSNQYAVYNIDKINLDKIVPGGFSYVNGADHSKWAANLALNDQSSKYACVGDINRQTSQFSRGGGTVCFNNNQNVWSLYYNLIDLTENCQLSSVSPKSL